MLKVKFRFGIAEAWLGTDFDKWDKTIFEYRQAETPRLLVQIKFLDGHKVQTRICDLILVEEKP